jgi:VCBS repeat-containing protein
MPPGRRSTKGLDTMGQAVKSRFLFFVVVMLSLLALPAVADVTITGTSNFSSLDGSAQDDDHTSNGVFTVNGNLTIQGTVNCNDSVFSSACSMKFAATGNITMLSGSALFAEDRIGAGNGGDVTLQAGGAVTLQGTSPSLAGAKISTGRSIGGSPGQHAGAITITSGGATNLQAGSIVSAAAQDGTAGNINVNAQGVVTAAGLVAAGPSSTVNAGTKYTGEILSGGLPTMKGGTITIKSSSHTQPAVTVTGDAIIVVQGGMGGGGLVTVQGCDIRINGLVASISRDGTGARVAVRSGTTITVDGRDVNAAAPLGRFGVIRSDSTFQGTTGAMRADLFAATDITILGPNPAVSGIFSVNANGGALVHDLSGAIRAISTGGSVTASGNAFSASGPNLGDRGGSITVAAKNNVTLNGATLKAKGDTGLDPFRRGGQIDVRSHSGAVTWQSGVGDVRPVGSSSGLPAAQQGSIALTYCTTVSTSGTSFPTNGAPVGMFPTQTQTCSPAAPSLPAGEPALPNCNQPPVANNDTYMVAEGGTLNVAAPGVLTNDVDPDGDPMTVALVTGPAHASSFTLNPNGSFTYVHDGSETTSDSFTYQVSDGAATSNVATVNITVTPVNDVPVANNDSATVAEGGTINFAAPGVLANDTDPDGPALTAILVTGPAHASSFTLNPNGSWVYVHDGSETTSDSFTYKASDGIAQSNTATVSITITPVNDAPVANNDSYNVNEGGTLNTPPPGVLGNDTDPDSPTLTAVLVSGPAHASSFTLNPNGSFNYVHNGSETTSDSFTYRANDGSANSNIATVTITVNAVNDTPVAVNDGPYTVAEGGTFNLVAPGVLANDIDPDNPTLTAILVTGPAHAASFSLNPDGSFSYVHDGSETLSDSFTYKASDGTAQSNVATVSITITPVNDAPVAVNDSYNVNEGGTLSVATPGVLGNDTDPDSPVLTAVLVSGPAHASSFTLNPDGSFNYVHDGTETSTDSFTYRANDGSANSNMATVTITVNPVNDPPVANNDAYTVNEGGTLSVAAPGVLGNDTDSDSPSLTAVLVSGPAHASSFALNADGSFNYVHDGSETISDSFTYRVNDGSANSNIATVTITVTPVNDPPVAVNDAYNVNEGGTLNVAAPGVLGNDTDPDSPTLTAVLVSGPAHASSFTLNPDGSFSYVHDGSETTSDTFTYRANDGSVNSNVATVTITIAPVNDTPVAVNDAYNVNEGATLNVAAPGVLGNDTDPDNPTLTAVLVSGPAHASSFSLNPDGSFTYVHDGSETTTDSFTYRANDGTANSNIATVTITVTPVNDAPVAVNDSYSVNEGGTLNTPAPGVLGNDTDPDSPTLTAVLVTGPAHAASFSLNPDGSFNYIHDGSETTTDSFTYRANDGTANSNIATVTITITPVNDAPVANPDSYMVNSGNTLNVAAPGVLGNDTDPDSPTLTAILVTGPAHAATFMLNPNGSFTYQPNPGFAGTDTFTYKANDGLADSNVTTVTITVIAQPPVGVNDSYSAVGNTELRVGTGPNVTPSAQVPGQSVLDNDTDPDTPHLLLTVSSFDMTSTAGGSVTMNPNGTFNYLPPVGFTGTDTFHYTVFDGTTGSTATVTISVTNRVWYVNNTAAMGDGRSSSPFSALASAQGASAIGDYIYVHTGDTTSNNQNNGILLKNNQTLIGQGVALVVSGYTLNPAGLMPTIGNSGGPGVTLASGDTVTGLKVSASGIGISGSMVSAGSIATVNVNGGTDGVSLTNTVGAWTLSNVNLTPGANGLVIAGGTPVISATGLSITTTASGAKGISGSGSGTLNISGASSVSSVNGTAVDITGMTLGVALVSVTASNSATGIVLTSTSGSFAVNGDGSGKANGSGGSITNVTTRPVHLLTAGGTVSLSSMNMTLNTAAQSGILVDNNAGGTLAVNVTGCSLTGVIASASQTKALLQVEASASANVSPNVQNSFFNGSHTYGFFVAATGTAVVNVTVNQSGFGTDVNAGAAVNRPGTVVLNPPVIGLGISHSGGAQVTYAVNNNTFWGANGALGAIYAVSFSGGSATPSAVLSGTFTNNRIGKSGVIGSGCANFCAGLGLFPGNAGTFKAVVTDNDIRQVNGFGINFTNSAGPGSTVNNIVKFKGNTIAEPDTTGSPSFQRALVVSPGNSAGANAPTCAEIGGPGAAEKNNISGAWQAGAFIRVTNANNSAPLTLPGLTPATGASTTQVNAFIEANNVVPAGNVSSILGTAGINGGSPCP